jgi:hypothetical protein
MMVAIRSSETSVFSRAIWRYIPENGILPRLTSFLIQTTPSLSVLIQSDQCNECGDCISELWISVRYPNKGLSHITTFIISDGSSPLNQFQKLNMAMQFKGLF